MPTGPVRLLTRLPRPVRLLVLGTFINKAGSFIIPFLTLVLKRQFGLSDHAAGSLVAAYGIGSIASVLSGGALTDRLGRRVTILISLLGSGALAIGMGFAPSFRVFLPLLLVFGFVADLYRPAAAAIIGDVLPSHERVVGFAALRLAVNLGFAIGMGLGGVIADSSWRVLFLADGATTLLYAAIVFGLIPETGPPRVLATVSNRLDTSADISPWRDGVFLLLASVSFLFCCVVFVDLTVLPLTVTMSAGYSATTYGLLVGANGLLIAFFEVPLVAQLRRFRRLKLAALGSVVAGIGFGMTGLVLHWSWFLASVVLWTAGEILVVPQQNAFLADWAPPVARGRYLGLYQATWSLGLLVTPLVFLPLHARLPESVFWGMLTLLVLPTAFVLLHLDRAADRPDRLRGASATAAAEEPTAFAAIASEAEG